ncbi:MAG: hypothetical protein KJO23_02720 [Bacteroidia bacterium]|nr:hypothetical protein [Bacteroidia bacterium]NNM24230.1 hypothetical protein [Flavobacteriaceae bacterium]
MIIANLEVSQSIGKQISETIQYRILDREGRLEQIVGDVIDTNLFW